MNFRDILILILVVWHIIDLLKSIPKKGKRIIPLRLPRDFRDKSHTRYYTEEEIQLHASRTKEAADLLAKVICADGTPGAFGRFHGPYGPYYSREKDDYGTHRIPSKAEAISFQLENFISVLRSHILFEGEVFK